MISDMMRFPFSMLNEDMDKWLNPEAFLNAGRRLRSAYPPINIGATPKTVEVYIFTPGLRPDELDVTIEKNLLSVQGERKQPEAAKDETNTYRQERFDGRFKRVITLPEEVNADKAEAVYKEGVLHISIPKREEVQPKQIKVSVE